jgi:site-specific recombinase XerD
MKNCEDNVFEGIPVGPGEAALFSSFIMTKDFSPHTLKAVGHDLRKFAAWFAQSNHEPFLVDRVTMRDVTDFRNHLHRDQQQAVATVNRALVSIRSYCQWLLANHHIKTNPTIGVKELKRVLLAPKGLDRSQVRRLLRELELRGDVRANAIFHLLLYSGCRVGDLVNVELHDLVMSDRSGTVCFRQGKGGKQRSVPLPLPARQAMQNYLDTRPPAESAKIFVGERGPLTEQGIRNLCDKYAAIIGVKLHPHLLRHTMAHAFLADSGNDLVALAQILGHENLNTTARYTKKTSDQLAAATDKLTY